MLFLERPPFLYWLLVIGYLYVRTFNRVSENHARSETVSELPWAFRIPTGSTTFLRRALVSGI